MRATFLSEFDDVAKTIIAWLNANTLTQHWDEAQQLLHRLKGSALIVAANDLYQPISSVHDRFAEQHAGETIDEKLRTSLRDLFQQSEETSGTGYYTLDEAGVQLQEAEDQGLKSIKTTKSLKPHNEPRLLHQLAKNSGKYSASNVPNCDCNGNSTPVTLR